MERQRDPHLTLLQYCPTDGVHLTHRWAETIARATGTPAEAVVIGEDADGRAAAMIEDGKAWLVTYSAG